MALITIYTLLPDKAAGWTLKEPPASYMANPDTNDHWRWSPSQGETLTALARADASLGKRFVPDFVESKWRVRVYIQMRAPEVSDRVAEAVKADPSRLRPCSFHEKDGPQPAWWNPTHEISIRIEGRHETYYLRPDEPEKIHYIRDDEFSDGFLSDGFF